MDEQQTPEELAAHFGPEGPVTPAQRWLDLIIEQDDYASAWELMTANLRLVRAQAWLWNNKDYFSKAAEDLDTQAAMLAANPSEHPYWDEFAAIELAAFQAAYPSDLYANVGISSRPRAIAPGVEIILFIGMDDAHALSGAIPTESGGVVIDGAEGGVPVMTFAQILVEHTRDGWRVAGQAGPTIPEPGWPPTI